MRWDDHPRLGAESIEDRQWTNLSRYANRMPVGYPYGKIKDKPIAHCIHYRKKLTKRIKGDVVSYHFLTCSDCGMSEIQLIHNKTGLWLNRKLFSRSPKDIRQPIIKFYEANNEQPDS